MRDYEVLTIQKAKMPDMLDISIMQQEIEAANNWKDAYWIGKSLYEQASGDADKLIMDAYEKAFELGLNIRVNRECFLTATQQIARIYFQFRKYDEAINKLLVLDSNVDDLPDWVNLYYASAQIHTENVRYWAEAPEMLFRRIDGINEADPESVKRRKYLFLEFIDRISELSKSGGISEVNKEAILEKADSLGLSASKECLDFKVALGIIPGIPELPEDAETEWETIEKLKEELIRSNEEIQRLRAIIESLKEQGGNAPPQPTPTDIRDIGSLLPRKQTILIIGGSETKEKHLRGKLKDLGFDFFKDQLEFQLEYDNIKDYASRIKPWSGKYAGIIVGPCPHKVKDIGSYASFIEKIKSEEGYPHVVEAREKSGTLKISKTSIGEAMMKMVLHLQTIA